MRFVDFTITNSILQPNNSIWACSLKSALHVASARNRSNDPLARPSFARTCNRNAPMLHGACRDLPSPFLIGFEANFRHANASASSPASAHLHANPRRVLHEADHTHGAHSHLVHGSFARRVRETMRGNQCCLLVVCAMKSVHLVCCGVVVLTCAVHDGFVEREFFSLESSHSHGSARGRCLNKAFKVMQIIRRFHDVIDLPVF